MNAKYLKLTATLIIGIFIGGALCSTLLPTRNTVTTVFTKTTNSTKILTFFETRTRTATLTVMHVSTVTLRETITKTLTSIIYSTVEKTIIRRRVPTLAIRGNKLVAYGEEIFLRGTSIADPAFLDWEGRFNETLFDEIKKWGFNAVRVPIHPIFWRRYPDYLDRYLDKVIEWCEEREIYVIIDWHAIGNPKTGETEMHEWFEWEPWKGIAYDANFSLAISAWEKISERYKNRSNVLYEIFNEPTWITWDEWKPLAEKLIDVIREHDDAVIIVGGVDWAYDLRGAMEKPIKGDNIAYAVHVYPGRPRESWEDYWGRLAEVKPLIITEWGFKKKPQYGSYLKGTRENFGEPLIAYAEGRVAGWVAWIFHPSWEPNMIRDWNYTPTDFGSFVKEVLSRRITSQ